MSRPPLPSNKGKTRTIKDMDGNKRYLTVLDEVTQEQSTNHDKVIYLQRIQFEDGWQMGMGTNCNHDAARRLCHYL